MPSRRRLAAPAIARQSLGLALAVPEVVGQRMLRMWLAGASPSRRDRDEFLRMWTEKSEAFYESWNAMALAMFRANVRLAYSPVWLNMLAAGLGPIHRRASANAKRLRRLR